MQTLKVPLKQAQKAKGMLMKNALLDQEYRMEKDQEFMYFPVKKRFKTDYELVEKNLKKRVEQVSLKQRLSRILTKQELKSLKTSMDTVGTIGIIEIEKELLSKSKQIGEEFLKETNNITTILRKKGGHEGELRIQQYAHVAGRKSFETVHYENGCKFMLDVNTVYFSMRLATERKRIMQQVKKGELVLVMFSGCAPYPVVLAKNTEAREVVGVELNKQGHEYGLRNISLNKLSNVRLYCGDVKNVVPKLSEKFDRILMPLPRDAEDFLETALGAAKKGTVIHLYNFQKKGEFKIAEEKVKKACKQAGYKCKILQTVKCGQNKPRFFRICVDFVVE